MEITQHLDQIAILRHDVKSLLCLVQETITLTDMKSQITDHAYLIERNKDVATYQHASTLQLFQTIDQADRKLELFIFNGGVWLSEGIYAIETIIDMVANPQ